MILWETHAHGQPARLVAINALQLQARLARRSVPRRGIVCGVTQAKANLQSHQFASPAPPATRERPVLAATSALITASAALSELTSAAIS